MKWSILLLISLNGHYLSPLTFSIGSILQKKNYNVIVCRNMIVMV